MAKAQAKAKGKTNDGAKKPNILVIWGDDIGMSNLSCYTHGLMGYQTPNIDRIAKEGMLFTDSYGEQSCTAGRSSFITGQSVYRTGLSKVGIPAAPIGMNDKLVTIAALLKEQGYATGQFGKNHLGDLNHMLPTNHGFDEFFGNLYHLNAEEEPEMDNYPEGSEVPRELRSARRDPLLGHRQGRHDGRCRAGARSASRRSRTPGPLTKKRMETCDDEFVAAAKDFIKRQEKAGKPWFVWLNTTHMHLFTHTKKKSLGQAGRWQSPYHDTMIDHDKNVGEMLDLLDELGIADDTFVQYSTDNGPHRNTLARRRHDAVPQREEHQLGRRVPHSAAGALARQDRGRLGLQRDRPAPRLAADLPRHGRRARRRRQAEEGLQGDRPHLQEPHRRLQLPALPHRARRRRARATSSSTSATTATCSACATTTGSSCSWSSACHGTMRVWAEPFTRLRLPKIFNLRTDPYEFADITSNTYYDWFLHNAYFIYAAQAGAAKFAETFKEFPPVQKPNTFTVDDALKEMSEAAGSS